VYKAITEGKGGITAKVVAKSVSESGKVICTFELEYPRFIHSEIMTHRLFSRNAMSSRAVPISKMIEQVRENPATPIHWGKNQAGMQAVEQCVNAVLDDIGQEFSVDEWWELSAEEAAKAAEAMADAGYHKQIVNRLLEPFQMMKTVLTATEFDNFFWLRCHSDAQPEIKELADCMYKSYKNAVSQELTAGEYHTPYVDYFIDDEHGIGYCVDTEDGVVMLSSEEALKVSASCCAQVSYRVLDNGLEKALMIYDKLVESQPVHASPFEHQATPMSAPKDNPFHPMGDVEGVTHQDVDGNYWSGNLKGWIQYRQLIPNNACWDYKD